MPGETAAARLPGWKRVIFITAAFVIMLGLAEGGAHAVDAFTGISLQEHRERFNHRRFCRAKAFWPAQRGDYPYLPFVPNPDDPRVNDLGFRGEPIAPEKPPGTYRIVCLGGSTTWDEYPAVLEDELSEDFASRGLKLEVINGGNVFWTSMESLINFITRCLPLQPDAVVVYHAINDAAPAFGHTTSADYSHWRGRLEKVEPIFWDKLPFFLDRSAAYVALRAAFTRHIPAMGWNQMTTRYEVDIENDPYNGVEPYRQNVYTLISAARGRGIETFLCTQVFNHKYEYKYSLERYGQAVDDINNITRSFGGRWGDVHVVDVAGSLEGGNDWMTDFCHFTPEGKVRLARFIASGIRPRLDRLIARHGDPCDIASLMPDEVKDAAEIRRSPRIAIREPRTFDHSLPRKSRADR